MPVDFAGKPQGTHRPLFDALENFLHAFFFASGIVPAYHCEAVNTSTGCLLGSGVLYPLAYPARGQIPPRWVGSGVEVSCFSAQCVAATDDSEHLLH